MFVDDFIALVQGAQNKRRVRTILLNAINQVFRPQEPSEASYRQEPVSIKKLKKGDCTWGTNKQILGWIIDTAARTIELPPHRVERLAEILASIPSTQKRITVTKWHKVLGELCSMALALPGARNLFGLMQQALQSKHGQRLALRKVYISHFKILNGC